MGVTQLLFSPKWRNVQEQSAIAFAQAVEQNRNKKDASHMSAYDFIITLRGEAPVRLTAGSITKAVNEAKFSRGAVASCVFIKDYWAVYPASTLSVSAVIKLASSDAKKKMAAAISLGSPHRCSMCAPPICGWASAPCLSNSYF